jgi:hypothetical protein
MGQRRPNSCDLLRALRAMHDRLFSLNGISPRSCGDGGFTLRLFPSVWLGLHGAPRHLPRQ